jgi:hypothetical protein
LHAFPHEPISIAPLDIEADLPSDVFVKRKELFILGLREMHFFTLATPIGSLSNG